MAMSMPNQNKRLMVHKETQKTYDDDEFDDYQAEPISLRSSTRSNAACQTESPNNTPRISVKNCSVYLISTLLDQLHIKMSSRFEAVCTESFVKILMIDCVSDFKDVANTATRFFMELSEINSSILEFILDEDWHYFFRKISHNDDPQRQCDGLKIILNCCKYSNKFCQLITYDEELPLMIDYLSSRAITPEAQELADDILATLYEKFPESLSRFFSYVLNPDG